MNQINRMDSHSHSEFSPDSTASILDLCERAIALDYQAYAITDHCECDLFVIDHYDSIMPKSLDAINTAKKEFGGKLNLLSGVEIGQAMQNRKAAEQIAAMPYDVVLGSLHRAKGMPDYYFINYRVYSDSEINALLQNYYLELLETAKWNQFDILGHLTYPLRYIIGDCGMKIDVHQHDDIVDEIFKTLIQNGKSLEINTSGLRQKIGLTLPDRSFIKRYRELGGELISIGSDAHKAMDLGKGIEEGTRLAYELGFRYVTYFKNRKPMLLPIEA